MACTSLVCKESNFMGEEGAKGYNFKTQDGLFSKITNLCNAFLFCFGIYLEVNNGANKTIELHGNNRNFL